MNCGCYTGAPLLPVEPLDLVPLCFQASQHLVHFNLGQVDG